MAQIVGQATYIHGGPASRVELTRVLTKKTAMNENLTSGSAGFHSLMCGQFALEIEHFIEIQAIYAAHRRGPKIDLKAVESKLGFPLETLRQNYKVDDAGVAIIPIDGLLAPKANLLTKVCGATSLQWAMGQLSEALNDRTVAAVVLAIESPGGSVFLTPKFAAAAFYAGQFKPVVAHSSAKMLAGAYWVGSAANAVFVSGGIVQVGGIGIVARADDDEHWHGATEVVAGRYRLSTSLTQPPDAHDRAYRQDQVNATYVKFVDAVALHRGMTPKVVNETMAEGRVFTGQQALDLGLIDGITSLDCLVNAVASNPAEFASRRRIAATRVIDPPRHIQQRRLAQQSCFLSATSQEDRLFSAVMHAKSHGISTLQAFKSLGFST